jgi:hypothetical protein
MQRIEHIQEGLRTHGMSDHNESDDNHDGGAIGRPLVQRTDPENDPPPRTGRMISAGFARTIE